LTRSRTRTKGVFHRWICRITPRNSLLSGEIIDSKAVVALEDAAPITSLKDSLAVPTQASNHLKMSRLPVNRCLAIHALGVSVEAARIVVESGAGRVQGVVYSSETVNSVFFQFGFVRRRNQ